MIVAFSVTLGLVAVDPASQAHAQGAECSGTVFRDDNFSGTFDGDEITLGNVTVNAYTDSPVQDTLVASTVTAANGTFVLSGLGAELGLRFEFTDLPAGHLAGPMGPDSGPSSSLRQPPTART